MEKRDGIKKFKRVVKSTSSKKKMATIFGYNTDG